MYSDCSIPSDGCATEELGQLSRGGAPQQIHLEEAILSVNKTESACHIEPVGTANCGGTSLVTLDANRRLQTRQRALSIKLWETAHHLPTNPERAQDKKQNDRCRNAQYDTAKATVGSPGGLRVFHGSSLYLTKPT